MFRTLTTALTRCSSRVIRSKQSTTIVPARCSGTELSSSQLLFTYSLALQNYSKVKKFAATKMRRERDLIQAALNKTKQQHSQNFADATLERESVRFLRFLDETVNSYAANIDLSAETFEKNKQMRDNEQKEVLGSLWKYSLAFNPLTEGQVDTRFIEAKVTDPVYSYFSRIALKTKPLYTLFSLRAVPGAGKTATILNAIGRNAFLMYTQCGVKSGQFSIKDYVDVPFEHFYDTLLDYVHTLIQRDANKDEKTKVVKEWCIAFWLCRVKLFHVLKQKYPEMKPSHWIFWTNTAGGAVLHQLQANVFLKLSEIKDWWSFSLESELYQCCKQQPTLWFAVDEAQVIQDAMKEHLITNTQVPHPMNLLHVLAVHSLPEVPKVVAGIGMARFVDAEEGSHGGKGSSIFELSEAEETYPYVTPEEAQRLLEKLIDFTGITKENMDLAKKHLQGRLRYVFGFIRHLYDAACLHEDMGKAPTKDTPEEKNKIFKDALTALEKDINDCLEGQWVE